MKHNLTIFIAALGLLAVLASIAASAETSAGGGLVFSGVVTGSWNQARAAQCELKARGGRARVALVGAVIGKAWTLSLDIGSYKGPGPYNAKDRWDIRAVLDDGSHNPNEFFTSAKVGSVLIKIGESEKSGTVEAELWSDTGRRVKVSGSWTCEG